MRNKFYISLSLYYIFKSNIILIFKRVVVRTAKKVDIRFDDSEQCWVSVIHVTL